MKRKHLDKRWQRVRNQVRPQLMAQLPRMCPRYGADPKCVGMMLAGMRLDVGHASRHPALWYEPSNLRLEHMACNRRDGQRITTSKQLGKSTTDRLPKW